MSCSDETEIPCEKSECDRCPNRVYENGVCRLKRNTTFRCLDSNDNEKVCQCSDITPTNPIQPADAYEEDWELRGKECSKCDGVRFFAAYSNCAVESCPSGYIQSAGGMCVSKTAQNTTIMVNPETEEECESAGWFYSSYGYCCSSQKVKECVEASWNSGEQPSDCPSINLV
jgi:hypothetical protein